MKENPIPTRDLKNGTKFVGIVMSSTFEAIKPTLERKASKAVLKLISRSTRVNY